MKNRQPGATTKAVCGHLGLLFVIGDRFVYNLTEALVYFCVRAVGFTAIVSAADFARFPSSAPCQDM